MVPVAGGVVMVLKAPVLGSGGVLVLKEPVAVGGVLSVPFALLPADTSAWADISKNPAISNAAPPHTAHAQFLPIRLSQPLIV